MDTKEKQTRKRKLKTFSRFDFPEKKTKEKKQTLIYFH